MIASKRIAPFTLHALRFPLSSISRLKSPAASVKCAPFMTALLYLGVLVLAFVSLLTVLIILMQRPSANAGMGAALGGGAAESAFGGEAGNVLTKTTNVFIILFLALSLALFLGFKASKNDGKSGSVIDNLSTVKPAAAAPAAPAAIAPSAPAAAKPAAETKSATPTVPATTTPATPAPTTPAPAPAK